MDTRVFLRDIDTDELLAKALACYVCLWEEGLGIWLEGAPIAHDEGLLLHAMKREMLEVIKDLADRQRRLLDSQLL